MNTLNDIPNDPVDQGNAELSPDDLDTVSGGDITPDTSGSYDAGYALTAVVKQIFDFGRGVWDGITDDDR